MRLDFDQYDRRMARLGMMSDSPADVVLVTVIDRLFDRPTGTEEGREVLASSAYEVMIKGEGPDHATTVANLPIMST